MRELPPAAESADDTGHGGALAAPQQDASAAAVRAAFSSMAGEELAKQLHEEGFDPFSASLIAGAIVSLGDDKDSARVKNMVTAYKAAHGMILAARKEARTSQMDAARLVKLQAESAKVVDVGAGGAKQSEDERRRALAERMRMGNRAAETARARGTR